MRSVKKQRILGGYGHHQAIIHGEHIDEIAALGEIVGFGVEVFQ